MLTIFMDGKNIWVFQGRGCINFTLETFKKFGEDGRFQCSRAQKYFDGNLAMWAGLLSQIYCTQGSTANQPLKSAGSQFLSDQRFRFHQNLFFTSLLTAKR